MKIQKPSIAKLTATFDEYHVPQEYSSPIINYLVYGLSPGSFFTAVLENDFMNAIHCSHMMNTIPALKTLVNWIDYNMPCEAYGSAYTVQKWLAKSAEERRTILERAQLILTYESEIYEMLQE